MESSKITEDFQSGAKKTTNITKKTWSSEEKHAVIKHFQHCFQNNRLPGKREIQNVLMSDSTLQSRKWTNVKDFIRNQLKKQDPLDFL